MKIPSDLKSREAFVRDLIEKCQVSISNRKADYSNLRSYYLFGAGAEDSPAQFNKIFPTIDQLISFLYAGDTTRFTIHLGATAPKTEYEKINVLTNYLNDKWFDTGGDKTFLSSLTWALAMCCTHVKLVWQDGINPYVVMPGCMGVLREDVPSLDGQEAISHSYYITKSELYRRLYAHPRREEIVKRLESAQHAPEYIPAGVDRIILSATDPNITGNVNLDLYGFNRMKAEVAEDTIEMHELWVWDTDAADYRCVTMADPDVMIYDRLSGPDPEGKQGNKGIYIKGEHPFHQVCPNPQVDYYWGASEVQRLVLLQQLRNTRLAQISKLLELQLNPPFFLSGMSGIPDEKAFSLDMPGSSMSNDMPNAKVDRLGPTMPEDVFREVQQIDQMFAEASGINAILTGQGEEGVRSQGHAAQLARLASARAKKRALVIEDALSKVATHYLKLLTLHDPTHFKDEKGISFTLDQFTKDHIVKVDAHSNSPIFMEDTRQLAFELFKAQAIDKESLLDLLDPPMKQLLKRRLQKTEEAQPNAGQPRVIEGGKRGGQ